MDWFLYDTDLSHEKIKGCVGYIFASLKESFYETRKNVFYFTSKALLFLRILKFKILDIHVSLRHKIRPVYVILQMNNVFQKIIQKL